MSAEENLCLRLVSLKNGVGWSEKQRGLVFVFVKQGLAECRTGDSSAQVMGQGDMLVFEGREKIYLRALSEVVFSTFACPPEALLPVLGPEEAGLCLNLLRNFPLARFYPSSMRLARRCHRLTERVSTTSDLKRRVQLLGVAALMLNAEFSALRGRLRGSVDMHAEPCK